MNYKTIHMYCSVCKQHTDNACPKKTSQDDE